MIKSSVVRIWPAIRSKHKKLQDKKNESCHYHSHFLLKILLLSFKEFSNIKVKKIKYFEQELTFKIHGRHLAWIWCAKPLKKFLFKANS